MAKMPVNPVTDRIPAPERRIRAGPIRIEINPLKARTHSPLTSARIRKAVMVLKRPVRIAHPAI
ncbi:MAG: hypothetical protein H6Q42_3661 [Deltaproteobacteria bacterium]|nr:hypothetical protein [Deltaproteobacteria bacterium]